MNNKDYFHLISILTPAYMTNLNKTLLIWHRQIIKLLVKGESS